MNINTYQAKAVAISDAFRMGARDAQDGYPFSPESYYTHRIDKIQYAVGFELWRGPSEVTRQFTHSAR